jgi:hypothetical protein
VLIDRNDALTPFNRRLLSRSNAPHDAPATCSTPDSGRCPSLTGYRPVRPEARKQGIPHDIEASLSDAWRG